MQHSTGYIVGFAAAVCLVASLFVAGSAVGLKDRQERNKVLDVQKKVLAVSNLMQEGASLTDEEVTALFAALLFARRGIAILARLLFDSDRHFPMAPLFPFALIGV